VLSIIVAKWAGNDRTVVILLHPSAGFEAGKSAVVFTMRTTGRDETTCPGRRGGAGILGAFTVRLGLGHVDFPIWIPISAPTIRPTAKQMIAVRIISIPDMFGAQFMGLLLGHKPKT
jgi:hypothetical protein